MPPQKKAPLRIFIIFFLESSPILIIETRSASGRFPWTNFLFIQEDKFNKIKPNNKQLLINDDFI